MALPTISAKDAAGSTQTVNTLPNGGQAAMANSVPVVLASDQSAIPVGGNTVTPTSSFSRPADTTAYASGDIMSDSASASFSGGVPNFIAARVAAGSFMIRRVRLRKSGTGITNASFRVHLFAASPGSLAADNAAFSCSGVANYLGAFDVTVDRAFTDGAYGAGLPVVGSEHVVKLASGQQLYWLLEARGAYTPASGETFTLVPEIVQD